MIGWPIPFIGGGLQFARGGPRWLSEQARRLGSPFTLYMMGQRLTFSLDPEFMRHFYGADVDEVSFYAGLESFPAMGDLLPLGLSGPEGASAVLEGLRRFLPAKVRGSGEALDAEARATLDAELGGAGEALAQPLLREMILRFTALLFVGEALTHDRRFVEALCRFDDAVLAVTKNPFDSRRTRAGLDARAAVVALLRPELERRRAAGPSEPEAPRDFIDAMLVTPGPDGQPLSDEVLALDINSMIWATAANTPAAAAMCLVHILRDPALHRRAVAEIDEAAAAHDGVLDAEAQKAMPLVHACYLEALRLYAPPFHIRRTMKPLKVGDLQLPAGALIAFSPYLQHRDPAVYTDPEEFDPERFIAGPRGPGKSPPASHFVPFGRGLHACLGRNLAKQEITLAIARLLRDYEVELVDATRPLTIDWITTGIAAPAEPQRLRVRRRSNRAAS